MLLTVILIVIICWLAIPAYVGGCILWDIMMNW